jgi:hypothetical protein
MDSARGKCTPQCAHRVINSGMRAAGGGLARRFDARTNA